MSVGTWFVIVIVAAVVVSVIVIAAQTKIIKSIKTAVSERFPKAQVHACHDGTFIAVDAESNQIALGRAFMQQTGGAPAEGVYSFAQIASVELNVDGATITSTNRGSQAVGAAVGALAFGGVGAVVGGLSGSSRSTGTVRRISLKVIVDDAQHPFFDVTFFQSADQKKGDAPTGIVVKQARQIAEQFHALLVGAIRSAERQVIETAHVPSSLTGQIKELWDLKEMGAITATEFEVQKQALLNRA